MSGSVSLRPADPEDVERILLVHVAAILDAGPDAYDDRQVAAWAAKTEGVDRYLEAIDDPGTDLLVATAPAGDTVVGFAELDRDAAELLALFVDPEWTGNGVGSTLLEAIEGSVATSDVDRLRLRAVRNAVGFYEERGYERVERVVTETTAGVAVESVWMEKRLDV